MSTLTHHTIQTNGINLHFASQGTGPLVVLCHGFPGLWYSWRHQLSALADAGYRAIAIDQRGYGASDRPLDADSYDSTHNIDDLVGLLDALGEQDAVFVGHDFGAPQVWNMAVRRPQRVRAIIPVACPYDFDLAGRGGAGSQPPADAVYPRGFALPTQAPSQCFAAIAKQHFLHMHYFQQVGPADSELGNNVREFLNRIFWALSADGNLLDWSNYPSEGTGYLDVLAPAATALPWKWLSQQDLDYYVDQYERLGPEQAFIGGLNSYRIADKNWQIGAEYADALVHKPTLFISGVEDPVLQMIGPDAMDIMHAKVPGLRGIELIKNAGHFVQQEQPQAFNRAVIEFLKHL